MHLSREAGAAYERDGLARTDALLSLLPVSTASEGQDTPKCKIRFAPVNTQRARGILHLWHMAGLIRHNCRFHCPLGVYGPVKFRIKNMRTPPLAVMTAGRDELNDLDPSVVT
jgi:hypothetical protein